MNHNILDRPQSLHSLDSQGMIPKVENFYQQCAVGVALGRKAKVPSSYAKVRKIVVTGLGGSAIGGDYLRASLAKQLKVPVVVNRHYVLPKMVDRDTLLFATSYSGNTEETLSSVKMAQKQKAKIVCVTSGGELLRLAKRAGYPHVVVPGGMPPRASLGFMFFPTLCVLDSLKMVPSQAGVITETLRMLQDASGWFGLGQPTRNNLAKRLAVLFHDRIPVIYGGADYFDAVAYRWKCQINENSKAYAISNVIPEMNHNEIVGWQIPNALTRRFAVVFLRDKLDHPRVQLRMVINQRLIKKEAGAILEVWSKGRSPLAKMFYFTALGDFASVYLGFLNGVDPTPVTRIEYLKKMLAKGRA